MVTTRILFTTTQEQLEMIPTLIKAAVLGAAAIDGVIFDCSHLQVIGDSAYIYETVYYVPSGNYTIYMDVQQEIYLVRIAALRAEGIEFIFPTGRLYAEDHQAVTVLN